MQNQDIVQKLWNLCHIRDDGVTYHQYVTELTYLLMLKMLKEKGAEEYVRKGTGEKGEKIVRIPKDCRWDELKKHNGQELVVAALVEQGRLTSAEAQKLTGLSASELRPVFKDLADAGKVRVKGKARGTAYEWVG